GQRPARTMATFYRPPPLGPPDSEAGQLRIALFGVSEPGRLDHRLGHRVQHGRGIAGLVRVHRDQHIVVQGSSSCHPGFFEARRAMQLRAAQTSLEPQPHRVSRTGRGAVREPEHQTATAADSRASPPRSAPEDPRSPDSQPRSKQVADYECADCQARVLLEMRILANSGAQNYHLYMPLSWWSGLEPEPAAPP